MAISIVPPWSDDSVWMSPPSVPPAKELDLDLAVALFLDDFGELLSTGAPMVVHVLDKGELDRAFLDVGGLRSTREHHEPSQQQSGPDVAEQISHCFP